MFTFINISQHSCTSGYTPVRFSKLSERLVIHMSKVRLSDYKPFNLIAVNWVGLVNSILDFVACHVTRFWPLAFYILSCKDNKYVKKRAVCDSEHVVTLLDIFTNGVIVLTGCWFYSLWFRNGHVGQKTWDQSRSKRCFKEYRWYSSRISEWTWQCSCDHIGTTRCASTQWYSVCVSNYTLSHFSVVTA